MITVIPSIPVTRPALGPVPSTATPTSEPRDIVQVGQRHTRRGGSHAPRRRDRGYRRGCRLFLASPSIETGSQ